MGWMSRWISWILPAPPEIAPGEDVVFVDVRTRREYEAGHVKGARHIPHDQMASRWQELARYRNRRVLLYCRSGARSRLATATLRSRGFERAENAGGLGGLRRAGLAVDSGAGSK
jgi:rhodanese-related sulfurtransferase